MPEFKFFVMAMVENFSTMILTSSYKIMASYINAHALTLPNRMRWLKEKNTLIGSRLCLSLWCQYATILLGRNSGLCSIPYQLDSLYYPKFPNTTSNTSSPYPNTSHPKPGTLNFWLYSDRLPGKNDQLSPRCQNQEEEIEPFYEILPTSAPVLHQSPAEEVILSVDTPIEMNHKLCEDMDQEPTKKEQYQRLVGRLIYLAHTRLDIVYVVSVVSQFMHSPSVSHRNAVHRILRYLKSTLGKGLMFSKNGDLEVVGYTYADWAGSITDRRSTSGYFTFVGGNLVTWRSKKQNVVSRSSAAAEYRGMAHGVCELLWIKRLLTELGFKPEKPMELHCDNKSAIDIAHNPIQHDRTKHVEVDRHFIKEKIEKKIIRLPFVKSEDQLTDILTKAVCGRVFHDSLTKLGIGDIYAPT
ncbi:unnamed protein product [Prunus brigantina]